MIYYSEYVQNLQKQFKSLTDPDSVDWVRIEYEDILKEGGPNACAELASFLSDAFQKESTALQQNSELNSFYQKVWHDMLFRGFIAFPADERTKYIQQKVVSALKNGVDVGVVITSYLDAYPGAFSVAKESLASYSHDLSNNTETIGEIPVEISGRKYLPQVKYWIQDYLSFPTKNARRGNLDRLNYLNQSSNAPRLTQAQKQQLLAVLKLYDQFVNPPEFAEKVERVKEPEPEVKEPEYTPEVGYLHMSQVSSDAPVPESKPMPTSEPPSINIDQRLQDLKNRIQK